MFDSWLIDIDFSVILKLPVKFDPQWLHDTYEKSHHPYVSDNKKTLPNICNTCPWGNAWNSEEHTRKLHWKEQLSSSQCKLAQHFDNIHKIWNKISVPSFAYSVWPDMVKRKLTMMGDWQNALHVDMWGQGLKFLMPLIVRIFLELCLVINQISNFS